MSNPEIYYFSSDQIKFFKHSKEVEKFPHAFTPMVLKEVFDDQAIDNHNMKVSIENLREARRLAIKKFCDWKNRSDKAEQKLFSIVNYCRPHIDQMWAASIISMILDCDFQDCASALKAFDAYREKGNIEG